MVACLFVSIRISLAPLGVALLRVTPFTGAHLGHYALGHSAIHPSSHA